MSKQSHIIARTVLELHTQQLADVWSLQSDVSRLFQQQGVDAIAELFDQLVGEGEVVRLERVEVDIGDLDSRFLTDEFIHKLLLALREKLGDRLTEELLNKPETITSKASDWQVLQHFLRYGRLPWWCPVRDWQEWLQRWLTVMQTDTKIRDDLRELLINYPTAQQRLVEQFPEPFQHQLVLHLQPTWVNWHSLLTEAKQLIQALGLNRGAIRYLEQQAWLLLFGEITRENAPNRGWTANWTYNWLAQLVSIWRYSIGKQESRGNSLENSEQIIHQRLGSILAAVPKEEQSPWLTALNEALTSITDITQQNPESIFTTPSEKSQEQDETQVRTPQTDGGILLYFLQYGRFPGEELSVNWPDWLSRWSNVVQNNTDWQFYLRQLLRTNPKARQRLVTQLPEDLRHQLLLQLQPDWENRRILLAEARLIMQSLDLNSDRFQELEKLAWELLLVEIGSEEVSGKPPIVATWMQNWLTQLMQNRQEFDDIQTSIDAVSPDFRSLWLTAYHQVLNLIIQETSTTPPENDGEILLYFLQYGRFPGEELSINWPDWLSRWSNIVQNNTNLQLSIRQLLSANPEVQQRLVTQFPEDLRHQLLLQLQPSWESWPILLTQATELIQSLGISDNTSEELIQQAWLLLVAEIPQNNAPETPLPATTWTRNWLIQLLQNWRFSPQFPEEIREQETENREQTAYQHLRSIITTFAISQVSPWLTALEQVLTTSINSPVNPIITPTNNSILSTAEETAGMYISQAGLVLVHPFIRFYLEAVGLLNNESFQDEFAQQTAIYLLYYLATKQTDTPESELVLPKLLCGWPLNQPVARGLDLPDAALEEGERLLQTVINYWQVLKSTSPDGLREGFLQRQGKLTRTGDGNWKLQVEQQAIDILLGSLPWGVSMVTLPWMEGILMVEWT